MIGTGSAILVLEVVGSVVTGSLALLADAGHVLTDIAGVSLALLAIWFGSRPATERRTFGFYRLEILAAIVNALVLFGISLYILFEAWRRFREPIEVASTGMLAIAAVGLAVNLFAAWLLRNAQRGSLNLRGAYLEVVADALGSVAVIVAAVLIAITGWTGFDPIASVVIGLLIVPRTWGLLREAMDVLLEATPKDVDITHVREHILGAPGVTDVHDLHIWSITSGMNLVSAHVVVENGERPERVLDALSNCLSDHFDMEHSTFQLEGADRRHLEVAKHV